MTTPSTIRAITAPNSIGSAPPMTLGQFFPFHRVSMRLRCESEGAVGAGEALVRALLGGTGVSGESERVRARGRARVRSDASAAPGAGEVERVSVTLLMAWALQTGRGLPL